MIYHQGNTCCWNLHLIEDLKLEVLRLFLEIGLVQIDKSTLVRNNFFCRYKIDLIHFELDSSQRYIFNKYKHAYLLWRIDHHLGYFLENYPYLPKNALTLRVSI